MKRIYIYIKVWCVDEALLLYSLRGHLGYITDLSISPNNVLLASSDDKRMIRVWVLASGVPVAALQNHADVVNYVRFDPRDGLLYSCSDDGTVRVWNIDGASPSGAGANSAGTLREDVPHYSLPHTNSQLRGVQTTTGGIRIRPIGGGGALGSSSSSSSSSSGSSSSGGGEGGAGGTVKVRCMAFNPLGGFLVTGGSDCIGRIWKTARMSNLVTDTSGNNDDEDNSNGAGFYKFKGVCWNCGKIGHKAADCWWSEWN